MDRACRGYMIQSTASYIEGAYDEVTRKKIYANVNPAALEVLGALDVVTWYPIEHVVALFRAIVKHHEETDGQPEKALENIGRTIASTAMSTFMRLVMKLMTVSLFSRKVGDFWSRDNRYGTLATESLDLATKQLVISHKGIGGYDYVAGTAPGFIKTALEAIGCKNVQLSSDFTVENPSPDNVRYEVRWE